MKKLFLVFAAFVLSTLPSISKSLEIGMDVASFKYNTESNFYQLYFSFPARAIRYQNTNGTKTGSLEFKVNISYSLGEIKDSWTLPLTTNDTMINSGLNFYDIRNYVLKPGEYRFHIKVFDTNDTTNLGEIEFVSVINSYNTDHLLISDIEFANLIEKSDKTSNKWDSIFYKNNMFVIPNPQKEFIGDMPSLKYYAEVYNLKEFAPDGYNLNVSIFDGANREISAFTQIRKTFGDAQVETLDLPINTLSTGTYYLRLSISAPIDNPTDSSFIAKKFFVINNQIAPQLSAYFSESEMFSKSEFATYDAKRSDLEIKMALLIAGSDEIATAKALNSLEGKQHFLFRFWKLRDPDSTTMVNEKLLDYRKEIDYANINFNATGVKYGWSTDRGKTLLKYGFPTSREINSNQNEDKPYEDWFYQNVQGGVHFYFVDLSGYGDYTLVHSTAKNEPYNPSWMADKVQKNNFLYKSNSYKPNDQ